jgi:nucleoside-diphosphate-sugar epimerase
MSSPSIRVGVVGMSGFIGSHITREVVQHGHQVIEIGAPRLALDPLVSRPDLRSEAQLVARRRPRLMEQLTGCDVVVNCAGIADAGAKASPELFGANALLPAVLGLLSGDVGVARFIHISSAAVHGRAPVLIEGSSESVSPFSPYSHSKWMGEQLLVHARASAQNMEVVRYRPTSVHGATREVTRRLVSLASGPFSLVAGDGTAPTPQVQVGDVARAVTLLVECGEAPSLPVIHPWEGLTTGLLLEVLGGGRKPRRVPERIARRVVALSACAPSAAMKSVGRRLEMLWFGQRQQSSTLERLGYVPKRDWANWRRMAETIREDVAGAGVGLATAGHSDAARRRCRQVQP